MATIHEINPRDNPLSDISALAVVRGGITVKPHVQRFADALEEWIGYELSFGTYPGHSPPEGPTQALDVFNTDNASGYEQQDDVCEFAFAHAREFGVRYAIRRHFIKNVERLAEGWRDQGIQGNRTADHYDHTHITFYASAGVEPTPAPPAPIPTGDVMALSVTYVWGKDALNENDWVFDGPSRLHSPIGDAQVLAAVHGCKFFELGKVDRPCHEWFQAQASNWK